MKGKITFVSMIFIVFLIKAYSQENKTAAGFDFSKLKPIAQIFATAQYNADDNIYKYYFGRFDQLLYELHANEMFTGFDDLSAIIAGLSCNVVKGGAARLTTRDLFPMVKIGKMVLI